jgi:hypothetical protein
MSAKYPLHIAVALLHRMQAVEALNQIAEFLHMDDCTDENRRLLADAILCCTETIDKMNAVLAGTRPLPPPGDELRDG